VNTEQAETVKARIENRAILECCKASLLRQKASYAAEPGPIIRVRAAMARLTRIPEPPTFLTGHILP
jgi:hypothetical protein